MQVNTLIRQNLENRIRLTAAPSVPTAAVQVALGLESGEELRGPPGNELTNRLISALFVYTSSHSDDTWPTF